MSLHYAAESKSHFNADPKLKYCIDHSYKLHPVQWELIQATLDHPENIMLGATEVIQTCSVLLKQIGAKNVLDVGTFTGFSALSWALALPDDGRVITMDIQDDDYKKLGKPFAVKAGVVNKIDQRVQPALKTMDQLIADGQSGKFDFAFLDAEKTEYPQYYEKCLQLLRPGGFIAVDNGLWGGTVVAPTEDEGRGIDKLNKIIAADDRVNNVLLPVGDGLHLAFKK